MLTWWRRRRARQRRETRELLALVYCMAVLTGHDDTAAEFRRELDRMGGR